MIFKSKLIQLILCFVYFFVFKVKSADYVENEISTIGENVDQNFAFHPEMQNARRKQLLDKIVKSYYQPATRKRPIELSDKLDYDDSPPMTSFVINSKRKVSYKPSLAQLVYLLRNSRNSYPGALTRAKVIMSSSSGLNVNGIINLKQMKNGPVMIFGTIMGLPRSGKFGFHFHEYPIENENCESGGEHFNPYGNKHGDQSDVAKHVGDLGNLVAQYSGTAHVILTNPTISLGQGVNSIIGRSLIVHEYEDDLGKGYNRESLKSGNSGSRLACGTVMLIPPKLDAENNPNR